MENDRSRGRLIVFEGIEGAGKTTQLQQTHQWLSNQTSEDGTFPTVIVTREPGGTHLGVRIRQLLLEQPDADPIGERAELLLYAADRAAHVAGLIEPHLAVGAIVLCDRYTESTIAYQGYGRGLDLDTIEQLNQIATGGRLSDLTLWLDLDPTEGLNRARERGQLDRMERENLAFHQRVRQGYATLAQTQPDRIVRVEATGTTAEVQGRIQEVLQLKIPHLCLLKQTPKTPDGQFQQTAS
ncbi:dTMP kinase [Oscillatoriales cyanobacterium LEGE 11467]|uniref:Thymidylate kinase n=1 Tax=Zarconia navalis LEGE 11467 TaxID=1828826 RepID=A0A928Z8N3_9CYAN|nr:dTMP kinase [Zarconia navalis]MBE9040016.1 dTMP kinase [Zarconia navalis LEGE 11467]